MILTDSTTDYTVALIRMPLGASTLAKITEVFAKAHGPKLMMRENPKGWLEIYKQEQP